MGKKRVFELKINPVENSIVNAIAFVEEPAIEVNFLAFNKEYDSYRFSVNDEKMELIGPAMIPNQYINRIDQETGEAYDVFFSENTIREISQQYFKHGFQNNLNLNHSLVPAKSFIFQSYIVDESKGIYSPKGIKCPNGTWIIGVKVEDKDTWNDIKAGKVKGFSIEGTFKLIESGFANESESIDDIEIMKVLDQLNAIIKKIK